MLEIILFLGLFLVFLLLLGGLIGPEDEFGEHPNSMPIIDFIVLVVLGVMGFFALAFLLFIA